MSKLNRDELELLRQVLASQAPARMELVGKAGDGSLADAERGELCGLIAAELAATGLDDDDEPNPRGALLESLLDAVNRPRLRR